MDFFENLGGFLIHPHRQAENNLKEGLDKQDEKKARHYSQLTWIYGGIILSFLYVYPEMLYYPESRQLLGQCWPLYVSILGQPWIFASIFLLSYIVVVKLNRNEWGSWSYKLGIRLSGLKKKETEIDGISNIPLSKKQFQTIFAYTITPVYIWGFYGVYRLFFTEKIQITSNTLPFFNWSMENIIFWSVLVCCLIWKWIIELKIQIAIFNLPIKKGMVSVSLQILSIGIILLLIWAIGTLMIPMFT